MPTINRTTIATSDPIDICRGFNLFKGGSLRDATALQLGVTSSRTLLAANPQIAAWRASFDAGYHFFAGVCGPAYAIRFDAPWRDEEQLVALVGKLQTGIDVARPDAAIGCCVAVARKDRILARLQPEIDRDAVTIPVAEVREYSVLLALDRDGRPLSVRERGPLWVIYPWQQHPGLDDRVHRQRAIWQLTRIDVV